MLRRGSSIIQMGSWKTPREQLKSYRELYAQFMEEHTMKSESQDDVSLAEDALETLISNKSCHLVMRKSILGWGLAIGANDMSSRVGTMRVIFEHIDRLTTTHQQCNSNPAISSESLSDSEVYNDLSCNDAEATSSHTDESLTSNRSRDTNAQSEIDKAVKETDLIGSEADAPCNISTHTSSTATSDGGVGSNANSNSIKGTSAQTDELRGHNESKIADGFIQRVPRGQEPRFAGAGDDAMPTCSALAYEGGKTGSPKPICHRIQNAFRYNEKFLRKKKLTKAREDLEPLPALVQPVTAIFCPTRCVQSRGSRIQGALEHTVHLLRRKSSNVPFTRRNGPSTNHEPCASGVVENHRGHFGKYLHVTAKSSDDRNNSGKLTETQSETIGGHSSKDPKPFQGRIRNAFQKAINLLRNKKSMTTSPPSESQPALVESCVNVVSEPIEQSSPVLQNDDIEVSQSPRSPDIAECDVEEVCGNVFRQLEGAFATMSQEHRAFVELVIRTGVQSLKNNMPPISGTQPDPEVLESSDAPGTEGINLTEDEVPNNAATLASTKIEKKDTKGSVFSLWTVAHEIADDKVDEEKWKRLHRGFLALWDSL